MAPTCGSGDTQCAAMTLGSRPGLFTILLGGLAIAACGPSGATSGTGAFGGGAGQLPGSCGAVSAKLAECGLQTSIGCATACEGECVQAASCSELDAVFAGQAPQGSFQACLEACSSSNSGGEGGGSSSNGGGGSGGSDGGSSGGTSSGGTSSGSASSSSGSNSSGSSSSGGLVHPECETYGETICSKCDAADPCDDGEDCVSCAATTCDLIYDQCSAWLNCMSSTCGSDSCCGMPCSPC
jgi:hypothetical protein